MRTLFALFTATHYAIGTLALATLCATGAAQAQEGGYRLPPEPIVRAIDATGTMAPLVTASPGGEWVLIQHYRPRPSIKDLARPVLGLAGWIVDPSINRRTPYPLRYVARLTLTETATGEAKEIPVPSGDIGHAEWSPTGRHFALLRSTEDRTELWIGEPRAGTARVVPGVRMNAARVKGWRANVLPCRWTADGAKLFCLLIPAQRGEPPSRHTVISPQVQDTRDRPGTSANLLLRTEHRLQSATDELLYDYYMTAQPAIIDVATGAAEVIGPPAVYDVFEPSPDGRFILSVRIVRPYSYQTMDDKFPRVVDVLTRDGTLVRAIAQLPADTLSSMNIGRVSPKPRLFFWRPGAAATLGWYESLDGGDTAKRVAHRDRMMFLPAPFDAPPVEIFRSSARIALEPVRTLWGNDGLVIVEEYDWDTHVRRAWAVRPDDAGAAPRLVLEYSGDEPESAPGEFVTALGSHTGRADTEFRVLNARLLQDGDWLYLRGTGKAQGGRPFVDRIHLRTGRKERLFQSRPGTHEEVISVLDSGARRLVTSIETPTVPQNIRILERRSGKAQALTHNVDPVPELTRLRVEHIEYRREDGVRLHGELYLPADVRPERLPVIISAYPLDYASAEGAGQRRDQPNRFRMTAGYRLFTTQGYAVLSASMPIVGGPERNDTFSQQLEANARAAIDKLVDMGVADRSRIGVTGLSYGGLMTANLLANTDLFAAGVALSGLFNTTLMPFGFQRERRTYWQSPESYDRMSPFRHADRIKAPLLLIHGERDNATGTPVLQSTRYFEALYGLGATSRLVVMPHEGHGMVARESLLHQYWEMLTWFDRYVKNR